MNLKTSRQRFLSYITTVTLFGSGLAVYFLDAKEFAWRAEALGGALLMHSAVASIWLISYRLARAAENERGREMEKEDKIRRVRGY